MGIEDRDTMRQPDEAPMEGKGRILGVPKAVFFLGLLLIVALAVWKGGVIEKLFPRGPINVNTATIEQLKDLPGVDKKIAQDFIDKRPFKDVDDVKRVKGIGDKKLAELRALITIGE